MRFHIMTIFPRMVEDCLSESIIGRAIKANLIEIDAVNIRDFSKDKHGKTDDYPYGGGAGMVMSAQPIYDCYRNICERAGATKDSATKDFATNDCAAKDGKSNDGVNAHLRTIYLSPQGKTFDQNMAKELAKEEDIILLCGHYEGVDQRVLDKIVTDYVSIGDYVLTGGELPAMVMVDAIARMVPGVLTNEESGSTETFEDDLLEYPQYTRPEIWEDMAVPSVLLSGDHARIDCWRQAKRMEITRDLRLDLYDKAIEGGAQWPMIKKKPATSDMFE